MAPLTIWTNLRLDPSADQRLRQAISPHRLITPAPGAAASAPSDGADPLLQAHIAFGQPNVETLLRSSAIRWIHINTAGYTRYDREDLPEHFARQNILMTNSSSVYAEPCAQHALAMMLGLTRQLPHAMLDQQHHQWHGGDRRAGSTLLNGQTVLILGFGAIARRLVELLAPFQMRLLAVRRTITGNEPIPVQPFTDLDRLLPQADHVVNLLPANSQTRHFIAAHQLSLMQSKAIFYNLGRGATVDQPALIDALTSGKLAAAYLDVTDPEPLPPDHPLWTTPNCYITPHSAGGHRGEHLRILNHFLDNLHRFQSNQPLLDRII